MIQDAHVCGEIRSSAAGELGAAFCGSGWDGKRGHGEAAVDETDRVGSRQRLEWSSIVIGDRLAVGLAHARHLVALPLARAAKRFVEGRDWFSFGYARIGDHARERFARSGRWVRDLRSLAEAVERCPALARALSGEDGLRPIGTVAALLIARVATPETCDEWIELARRLTVRELRESLRQADDSGAFAASCGATRGEDAVTGEEEDPDDRLTVRLAVPPAVEAALDEARELHMALCGGEASLEEFVEALVAEAFAGPAPPLVNEGWIGAGPALAAREWALERETEAWAFLDGVPEPGDEICDAARTLRETTRLCREAEAATEDPDSLIRRLLRVEEEIERRLGDLLALMGESGAWRRLRFSGVGHYAEERLGISRTQAEVRTRLARALSERPLLEEAVSGGRLGPEAAWLVVRVLRAGRVTDEIECAWIDRAVEATVKRLRDEVRIRVRDRAVCSDDTAGLPMDDATWHASRERRPGQSLARVAYLGVLACECPEPSCLVRLRLPVDLASQLLASVRSERDRLEKLSREIPSQGSATELGDSGASRAARMFSTLYGAVPEWVGLLSLIEDFVATWDDPRQAPRRAEDRIYIRDGWRCSAPGCTSRRNLEEHHIVYRSRGGSDEPSNLVTLCRFHHQQGEHGGLMRCRGSAPLGIAWWMGASGKAGVFRNERKVSTALLSLAGRPETSGPVREQRAWTG